MALEREGLLDRSDPRRPCLTEAGRARVAYYEERTNVVLNHLLYEGLDIGSAVHDAYAWALIRSEHAFRLYTPAEELAISETIRRPMLVGSVLSWSYLRRLWRSRSESARGFAFQPFWSAFMRRCAPALASPIPG